MFPTIKIKIALSACSMICKGLELIAKKITVNTDVDDKIVEKIQKVVDSAQNVVDIFNPKGKK